MNFFTFFIHFYHSANFKMIVVKVSGSKKTPNGALETKSLFKLVQNSRHR